MLTLSRAVLASLWFGLTTALAFIGLAIAADAALAQSTGTFSANTMWGVSTNGGFASSSGMESSVANHLSQSAISNYVDAAKAGVILNPNLSSSVTIQSVGSQTIVSNTVTGNNNSTSISGTQTSSNSGSVSNTATTSNNN